jgi:predicted RNase H-like HicB family nuclease
MLEEAERNIKEAAALYLEDILAEHGVLPRSGLDNC